jgi:hypothetical protein
MKKLTKFWGVFLAIVLASTLILSAAPVSAGTLSWGSEDLPDEFVDTAGDNIVDMTVSGDGSVIYVTSQDTVTFKIKRSTNGGEGWTDITVTDGTTPIAAEHIAVTPDDPNYVAVSTNTGTVYITDDAGANWDSLGQVGGGAITDVKDLAISVEKGGNHFVAVAGTDGTNAEIWTYEIGAIGATWVDRSGATGFDAAEVTMAAAFSPNFYSDQVMVAITGGVTVDELKFQIFSYNTGTWNSGAFTAYPVNLIQSSEALTSIDAASIAMAPDYLGSDDSMRVAFVGLTVNSGSTMETSGVFRLDDDSIEVVKDEKEIYSVAFDGSLLVAGRNDNTGVYRSTNALDDSPSTSSSTSTKNPGGDNMCIVGIAGDTVVAGTSGDESSFAYSEDNGKSFNDISLIDTTLTTLSDVAVSPDGSIVYLVTADASADMSVWRLDGGWERVYSLQGAASDYLIRIAPDEADTMYLADAGGTNVYYSSTGGMDKWHTRIYKETSGVVDMAIEGDGDTIYILTTNGYVSKSTNRGFTWDSKKSSKLSGGSSTIVSLGEDLVLAGSSDGRVAYSTDGNTSWTKITDEGWAGGANPVHVAATGLSDGDFIIAACGAGVNAWELGADDEWDDISPSAISGNTSEGIGIMEGVLYVIAEDGTDSVLVRTLTPKADDPTWSSVESDGERFNRGPSALRMSMSGDVTKLWAIDADASQALFSYKDTLATVGVSMSLPANAAQIPFNPVSGASNQIIFSWTSPSDKVSDFDFVIATDTGFNEVVLDEPVTKSSGTWKSGDVISKIVGPGAGGNFAISFMPETTYYWRVRVDAAGPVRSAWSEVRSFTTGALPEQQAPVVIQQPPAPVIEVPPTPEIILQPPEIVLPAPTPAPEIVIPSAPAPAPAVPSWAIYAIIIIGAVLVIALIVLIMRTRRPV